MIATPFPRESLLYAVSKIPAAPRILASLGQLMADMNSGLNDFTELLKRDPALTARILRISNSAVYNVGSPFSSLEEALARVGCMEVYRMTGFAAVAQVSDQWIPLYGIRGTQIRENSLLVALVIEEMAKTAQFNARAAYTAGLLRSMGKLALDGLTRDGPYNATYQPRFGPVAEWETAVAGLNNCEAAAFVLQEWHFLPEMVTAIHSHYAPGGSSSRLTHLLNLAAGAAERAGHGLPGESTYWQLTPEALEAAGLDEAQLVAATDRAVGLFSSVRVAVS